MIQKIAKDVSEKLNTAPSSDFEDIKWFHKLKLKCLLDQVRLEPDDVIMIGIWGSTGVGKTTIARALYSYLSCSFQLRCFMGNLKGSCKSKIGVDEYGSKLYLQSLLLSNILNQRDMKVDHLGAIKEWLHNQKVLIILDSVDDREQLNTLAKELSWFGSGSRIIVTTENKNILKAHGINHIYHLSRTEAMILPFVIATIPWEARLIKLVKGKVRK